MITERIYLISDRRQVQHGDFVGQLDVALAGLPPRAVLVQLREKDLGGKALLQLARATREVTWAHETRLLINDRVDLALAVGADGVHLPGSGFSVADARELMGPESVVAASTHDLDGALGRLNEGADLITLGPIWETPSKRDLGAPVGTELLAVTARTMARTCPNARLFALGGVDSVDRAKAAISSGAHGIGVIRAVLSAPDAAFALRELVGAIGRGDLP
ncbi:MAG: thiamine phosphate synthase [Deltaproteobacteria bacterium]|nr:thiamine phosphate synthase [Deltaproteobacteria bacterium]